MATTADFTKFIYASDQVKYAGYGEKSNNDIAFIGGSDDYAGSLDQRSGIWAQGMFFPTPYAANDLYTIDELYTRTEVDAKIAAAKPDLSTCVKYTDVGVAGGVAALDSSAKVPTDQLPDSLVYTGTDGKIPSSVLPSYVDDVKEIGLILDIEPASYAMGEFPVTAASQIVCTPSGKLIAYEQSSGFYRTWTSTNPLLTMEAYGTVAGSSVTPTTDKIYVTLDDNRVYRYSGSTLVEISSGALSDAEASTLLNEYIKTIANGTATAVTNAAEIDVVTGAGTKTNSTSKGGATQTLARSKAATKTYVDKMTPTAMSTTASTGQYISGVSVTRGSITSQATVSASTASFNNLTLQVNGTVRTTYNPSAAKSLNLTTADFVSWTIL